MRLFGNGDRRTAPRRLGSHSVTIFVDKARFGEAQLADQSQTGARLGWRMGHPFPIAGVIFDQRSYRASSFRKVWQRGGYVGVRFARSQDVRGLVAPEFQHVKLLISSSQGGARRF